MNSKRRDKFRYTFQEFEHHFRAMAVVRNYDRVQMRVKGKPEQIEIGSDRSLEAQVLRIMDYMSQIYKNKEECAHKGAILATVMNFCAQHGKEFEKAGLAYLESDPEKPSHLKHSLVKAFHHAFCGPGSPGDPTAADVIRIAKGFESGQCPETKKVVAMEKKMEEIIVKTMPENGQIEIYQPNLQSEDLGRIWISPDQVDILIKWLKEAKNELCRKDS